MTLADLAARARDAAASPESVHGLERLDGGMKNDVFAARLDSERVVVKVFRQWQGDEHYREWDGLWTCDGTRLAPRPLLLDECDKRPVLVSTWIDGAPIAPEAIGSDHCEGIGHAHRRIHSLVPRTSRLAGNHPGQGVPHTRSLFADTPLDPRGESQVVRDATRLAEAWLDGSDPDALVAGATGGFVHGDPNLSNCLFAGGEVRLIDWEHSGIGDLAAHVADTAEHLSTRPIHEDLWEHLAEAVGLSGDPRIRSARRLSACFWLVILRHREGRGAPPVQLTAEQQARRVLDLLS